MKNEAENPSDEKKCGFVAIIGAPNAGKSTLVNNLIGQKISIVTSKVQTTRFPVRGIFMHDQAQIILIDTPGIFAPKERLGRAMVASAWGGATDADLLVHVVDAPSISRVLKSTPQKGDKLNFEDVERVHEGLKNYKGNVILALNKVDLIDKPELFELAKNMFDLGFYKEVVMISALNGSGLAQMKTKIAQYMPIGPWHYPEDQVADLPLRMMASEITREKVFLRLHEELPYLSSVETENWKNNPDGSVRIDQTLYVGREGHKAIAIGKGGETLKWISMNARKEMCESFEREVHLFLHVKVRENWMGDPRHYNERGLDFNA
ncbi:MAG: GTP-binding protein Era [Hyphomonadaceae bacterium]|nr:MAG: GTP-binding protein Era [Hyphomonadaceae bacterium]